MAWTADGKWTPENDSTADKLTGLLADDSKYITQARASGVAQANKRGLMNSSIAAGTSEAAAIAAALPIASQDASQTAQKNNATLEGNINLSNSTKLNEQQNAAELIRQKEAAGYTLTAQENAQKAEMERTNAQIAASDRQALLASETSIANTKTQAASDLSGQYLNAVSSLGNNPKLKAADRNAYIAEFQRVTQQSQTYVAAASAVQLSW